MKALHTLLAAAVLMFASIAQAQLLDRAPDNGFAALYKPGQRGPEVWVFTRAATDAMDQTATDALYSNIVGHMQEYGYVLLPDPSATPPRAGMFDSAQAGIDGRTRCDVAVAVYGTRQPSPNIDVTCGPANTYGNGLYVVRSFNTMTTRNMSLEVLLIADHVGRAYQRAKALELFETAFARH